MNFFWNVSVIKTGEKSFITGYHFYAKDIRGAIEQGEKFGTVVKAVLSEFDEE